MKIKKSTYEARIASFTKEATDLYDGLNAIFRKYGIRGKARSAIRASVDAYSLLNWRICEFRHLAGVSTDKISWDILNPEAPSKKNGNRK